MLHFNVIVDICWPSKRDLPWPQFNRVLQVNIYNYAIECVYQSFID
jgi:hypothetical protein